MLTLLIGTRPPKQRCNRKSREVFNLTSQIKAAREKSAFRDGIILVFRRFMPMPRCWKISMHGSAKWRQREMTSSTDGGSRVMPFQSLLLHHQVFVSTERRLALGSIQTVLFH